MDYRRIALVAIVATLVDFAYGFVVYGNLLTASFAAQPGIYRSAEAQMANMPVGAAGLFIAMVAAAALFAWGGQRSGLVHGLIFGALLAVFAIGTSVLVNYATIIMAGDHAMKMVAAAFGEWLTVGAAIGLTSHPPSTRGR